jgi:hypothetical protein
MSGVLSAGFGLFEFTLATSAATIARSLAALASRRISKLHRGGIDGYQFKR